MALALDHDLGALAPLIHSFLKQDKSVVMGKWRVRSHDLDGTEEDFLCASGDAVHDEGQQDRDDAHCAERRSHLAVGHSEQCEAEGQERRRDVLPHGVVVLCVRDG